MDKFILIAIILFSAVLFVRILPVLLERMRGEEKLPYERKKYLLTKTEVDFLNFLEKAVAGQYVIVPQVRLIDLFYLKGAGRNYMSYRGKIDRKSVDFVLLERENMSPVLAIELDDHSHDREKRKERDEFVNRVFETAGLPLVRFKVHSSYTTEDISAEIDRAVKKESGEEEMEHQGRACPQCDGHLVLRKGSRGSFYGCSHFPRCKYTAPS